MRHAAVPALLCAAAVLAGCHDNSPTAPTLDVTAACGGPTGVGVDVAVGGVVTVSDPGQMSCIVLPPLSEASEYVVIAANANTQPDVTWRFTVTDTGGAAAAASIAAAADLVAPPAPLLAPSLAPRLAAFMRGGPTLGERLEARRAATVRRLPMASARAVAAARGALPAGARASVQGVRAALTVPAVGDLLSYRVPDTVSSCANFFTVGARVRAVSQHAIIVEDTTAPAGGFTDSDYTSIATEFDNLIYPTDTLHFGSPGDLDSNGRIVILYTPRVNAETPRGSQGGYVAGFFFGGDLFPRSDCSQSNVGELFYLLAPDPNGQFSDPRPTSEVRQDTRGTIAHEFQHMINLAVRIRENANDAEATWLDEGLSHFAEELVGRAERGYTDMQPLGGSDIVDRPSLNDFYAFFAQNVIRYQLWLERPDTAGATSKHADQSLAVRGAAWALLRYAADQYSGGDVAGFTRKLDAGPDTGVANLAKRSGVTFAQLMAGWMPANYTSGLAITDLPTRANFLSWNMRSAQSLFQSTYPLALTDLAPGVTITDGQAISGTGRYFRVSRTSGSPTTVLRVQSPAGGAVTTLGASVYLVRTR